jgi:hypothetical protein
VRKAAIGAWKSASHGLSELYIVGCGSLCVELIGENIDRRT